MLVCQIQILLSLSYLPYISKWVNALSVLPFPNFLESPIKEFYSSTNIGKNLGLTMILAAILSGLGHIYLGFVKRGIIILIIGIVIWIVVSWLIPIPFSWLI